MRFLAVIILLTIVGNSLAVVTADQTPDAKQLIGYADNEINNFYYNAQAYWFNVSQATMHDSFADLAKARTDILDATSVLNNETVAFPIAAQAAFLAKRANYRIFLNMTQQLLIDANRTFYGIPPYVPKPENANATLVQAIHEYEAANMAFILTPYSFPPAIGMWNFLNGMELSLRQLWWNDDSVANLAKLAKQEVLAYLAQQRPIYEKQIHQEFDSLKESLLVSAGIPTLLGLILAITGVAIIVRNRRRGSFKGTLRAERIVGMCGHVAGSFFLTGVCALPVAGGELWLGLSNISSRINYYQLSLPTSNFLIDCISVLTFVPLAIIIINAIFGRYRIWTGLIFLLSFFATIVAMTSAIIQLFAVLNV